jgi:hypothetical protein
MLKDTKKAAMVRVSKFSKSRRSLFAERVELAVVFRAEGEEDVHVAGAFGNADNIGAIKAKEGKISILWKGTGPELLKLFGAKAKVKATKKK